MNKSQITDGIIYLKTLTFKRFWNGVLLLVSYYVSKITKKNYQKGFPISIAFEPTTTCNLRCPHCPSGLRQFSRPTGNAQDETFKKLLNEVSPYLTYLIFYFQGEPYINKHFLDWVKLAHQKNIYTATSTNAHYLTEEIAEKTVLSGLSRLIISLDGAEQETYQKYRIGGNIDKVWKGIENVVKYKKKHKSKTPFIMLQFIVFKHNEHEIEKIKSIGKELGIDKVAIKTAQIYDYENQTDFIPENGKYSRYEKQSDKVILKNDLENSCWKMWHSCVVTWDGKVVPCCFDKDATHHLGDLSTYSFTEIWQNETYSAFRNSLLQSRKEIDICQNCTEGTKVWA
ncbi:radical SAM/SPASM domain-containing protein [Bernardetia sp.]|uniref:radical SAM/SPASM domain-containing protein n=1 Tax=Bernardetia sp. TaxID=1937974 RepID=UPI0025C48812|nr:radical SAM/SPASM domain-containing protein [Bernardetia sp.]